MRGTCELGTLKFRETELRKQDRDPQHGAAEPAPVSVLQCIMKPRASEIPPFQYSTNIQSNVFKLLRYVTFFHTKPSTSRVHFTPQF